MLTSLDWLIIVFMGLAASTLLSLCLMFLLRNKIAKRVCFYVTTALGIYVSTIGLAIGFSGVFLGMIVSGLFTILMCVGAFVLERVGRKNDKLFLVSRIISAAALIFAMANAFLI